MEGLDWGEAEYLGIEDLLASITRHEAEMQAGRGQAADGSSNVELMQLFKESIAERDIQQYFDRVSELIPAMYYSGMPFEEILRGLARYNESVLRALTEDYAQDLERYTRSLRAYAQLRDTVAITTGEIYAQLRTQAVEEENRKVIRELSTPVIQVWSGISVMPLIGVVDSVRANQMMEQLLTRISELGTRIVILDVTGVPALDTEVANHFIRATRAAALLGARSIIVGISPRVAQTIVHLNIDLGGLETYGDMRSGLERAFQLLGYKVAEGVQA